jgi:two-component system response regulator
VHAFKQHKIANPVHVVHDGVEALEFIFCTGAYAQRDIAQIPKLIVLDLKLPLVNGLEVLWWLKAGPRTLRSPCLGGT